MVVIKNKKGGRKMKIDKKTIENDLEYLRQVSKPVDFKDDSYKEALKVLDEFCRNEENCMAMASVQLGIPLRLVYLKKTNLDHLYDNDYNEAKILINPVIIKREGLTRYWEACVSCLDNFGLVERPYKIEVEYYDDEQKKHKEVFEGFAATVLSHEMDHLDGILHMDKAIELLHMEAEERKEYRESHPYEIIRKEGEFIETPEEKKYLKKK